MAIGPRREGMLAVFSPQHCRGPALCVGVVVALAFEFVFTDHYGSRDL